ncbi:MAG: YpmA family protein [Desulfotomaculaceae bacterium]|nr:YpmA family protein [Desulfotomaculaceae bacterium]MDD4767202.1 YpmA family protein [Desulfotomaculaceae bacterium]
MVGKEHSQGAKLDLIATKSFKSYDDMYKVVDFLNKTLKDKKVIFGLTKNKSNDTMSISVYEI